MSARLHPGASFSRDRVQGPQGQPASSAMRPNVLARSLTPDAAASWARWSRNLENSSNRGRGKLSNALQPRATICLSFSCRGPRRHRGYPQEIVEYQVDGIVLASVACRRSSPRAAGRAVFPVVLFNRSQDGRHSRPSPRNFSGGREIARFLIAGGTAASAHRGLGRAPPRSAIARRASAALREAGIERVRAKRSATTSSPGAGGARRMFAGRTGPMPSSSPTTNGVRHHGRAALRARTAHSHDVSSSDSTTFHRSWSAYDLTTVREDASAMVARR